MNYFECSLPTSGIKEVRSKWTEVALVQKNQFMKVQVSVAVIMQMTVVGAELNSCSVALPIPLTTKYLSVHR